MFEFMLGDLQLHGPALANFDLKRPIQGLESPEYRISSYDKPGEDGGVISNALYGMRQVTLIGRVSGSNAQQYEENRRALSQACGIKRDSSGYPVLTRCEVITQAGNTYFFYAQVGMPKFPHDHINWSDFMIPLTVPESQIYGNDLVSSGSVLLPQGSGITWPVTWPLAFGGVTGGAATVTNDGTLFSWPVIRLNGQLTNPYIINTTTGKLMQLNYTIPAGSFVKIYMGDVAGDPGKRIMLNDVDSLIATKTSDSEWWAIEPGDNLIAFSSGNSADTGTMQLEFYPAVIGI